MAIDLLVNQLRRKPAKLSLITVDDLIEITFDASLEEVHDVKVDVTEHPVEKGAVISDHKKVRPPGLKITAVVSNTPIAIAATLTVPGVGTRDVDAWKQLKEAAAADGLVTVVTSLETYEDMAITSLSVPRNAAKGNSLEVTIDLKKMFTVESASVVAPKTKSGTGSDKKALGKKAPKNAGDEQTKSFVRKNTGDLAERLGRTLAGAS